MQLLKIGLVQERVLRLTPYFPRAPASDNYRHTASGKFSGTRSNLSEAPGISITNEASAGGEVANDKGYNWSAIA